MNDGINISSGVKPRPGGAQEGPRFLAPLRAALDAVFPGREYRRRGERYRLLFENIAEAIFVYNRKFVLTDINPRACDLIGCARAEMVGRNMEDLGLLDAGDAIEAMNLSMQLFTGGPEFRTRCRVMPRSGTELVMDVTGTAIRDSAGRVIEIFCIATDVTVQERMTHALRESEERFRNLFEGAAEGIVVVDVGTKRLMHVNTAFCAMLGYSARELLAMTVRDLHPAGELPRLLAQFEEAARSDKARHRETPCLRRDGSLLYVDVGTSTMVIDGRLCVVGFFMDTTEQRRQTELLRQSEEKFRSVVERSHIGVAIVNDRATYIYVNDELCRLSGYGRDEMMGQAFDFMFSDESKRAAREGHARRLEGFEAPSHYEVTCTPKGGGMRTFEARTAVYRDSTGRMNSLVQILDVTEKKAAEQALQQSRDNLESLIENNDGLACSCDVNYRLITGNRLFFEAAEKVFGKKMLPGAPLLTRNELPKAPPERRDRYRRLYDEWKGYLDRALGGEKFMVEGVMPPPLDHRYMVFRFNPIRTATGAITGVTVFSMDITDRKRSEELSRAIFHLTPLAVGITRYEDGRILEVNETYSRFTGYTKDELIGRTTSELGLWEHPADRERLIEILRRDGYYHEMEIDYRTKEGTLFTTHQHAQVIELWGEKYIVAVTNDITERKRLEQERRRLESKMQQAQKLESLGMLAGGIAHDFNNLLMAILGNIDLALLEAPAESGARGCLQDAARASKRAAELCRQMLAYSGKGRFEIGVLSLNDIVEDICHMLEISVSKKATFRVRYEPDLPRILADATQARQVVMNLVINASEAIGERDGVIEIATGAVYCDRSYLEGAFGHEHLPEGRYVRLDVTDTGCGMTQETIQKIFDPFFTTKFTGRGLGLAVVIGIVRGHRGAIRVTSEPEQGSTFSVLFPVYEGEAVAAVEKARLEAGCSFSGTVLLVDDEDTIRGTCRKMLERFGLEVLTARGGREALETFRAHADRIAVVLLDLTMPGMDGEETLREIRAIRSDVRVLMTSGYSGQEVSLRFSGAGKVGFIQKPYLLEELAVKLRETMG